MLRRTKNELSEDGKKNLNLKTKHEEIIYLKLSESERNLYNLIFKRGQTEFS